MMRGIIPGKKKENLLIGHGKSQPRRCAPAYLQGQYVESAPVQDLSLTGQPLYSGDNGPPSVSEPDIAVCHWSRYISMSR